MGNYTIERIVLSNGLYSVLLKSEKDKSNTDICLSKKSFDESLKTGDKVFLDKVNGKFVIVKKGLINTQPEEEVIESQAITQEEPFKPQKKIKKY